MSTKTKIGFIVGGWGPMGHCLVSRNFRNALEGEFETHVFASKNYRPGGKLIQTKNKDWNIPRLVFGGFPFQHFGTHKEEIRDWIEENNIELVVFNEMFNWGFVDYCKQFTKVATYLDYFNEEWFEKLGVYDLILISTKRTFDVFRDWDTARYIPWGIDTDLFKPQEPDGVEKSTFFHSAGWGGYNWRKNTPLVLRAFYELRDEGFTYFLHSQIESYPEETANLIEEMSNGGQLKVYVGSVSWPGLYHYGEVQVCPTKLEGLGMFLPEGLSVGLPAITTDASPMNEFVDDEYNGLLVKTTGSRRRRDYGGSYYFPEYFVNFQDLKEKIKELGHNNELRKEMGRNAREFIKKYHSFDIFRKKSIEAINSIL